MTKKIIAILLACVLMIPCAAGLCADDGDPVPYTCDMTKMVIPTDPAETLNSDAMRAMLSVCLLLDLGITEEKEFVANNIGELVLNDSYVASDGQFFAVTMFSGTTFLFLIYDPKGQTASYNLVDIGLAKDEMPAAVEKVAAQQQYYYKNDPDTMMNLLMSISQAQESQAQ